MPDILAANNQKFLHRDKEEQHLINLFGGKDDWTIPCIYIYGQKSSGKTALVQHLLQTKQFAHVMLNCIECYSQSLVFENILRGVNTSLEQSPSCEKYKCDNGNDFVSSLKSQLSKCNETFYLVFDKAEYLRDLDDLLLPLIVNLQSLSGCNLCVIMISELSWEKLNTCEFDIRQPHLLYFPDYSKNELMDLLCHTRQNSDNVDDTFYRNYVHILVNVFSIVCRDLRELQYLAHTHYEEYCKPVAEGKVKQDDHRRLWKAIEPRLKEALKNIYFRTDFVDPRSASSSSTTKSSLLVELPFYSKFLLIAAYIASFNPPSSDRRFFVKNAGKMKKRVRHANVVKSNPTNCHLQGPHSFALNRMMAIFYAIIDGRIRPTINLFSQVTNLVSLRLLVRMSRDDEIDSPKYKCLASIQAVSAISKTVDFDIQKYLYDFV